VRRSAKYRESLDRWARGPSVPSHDFRDLEHFTTYIERRAIAAAIAGYLAGLAAAAGLSSLIWGVPMRIFVALFAIAYWPTVWQLYLRHHYRPEYRANETDAPAQ